MRSAVTENGEHGASTICSIEPGAASWYCSITRTESFRIASSDSTQSSGGRPPFDWPSDMLPRETTNRMPSSAGAAIWSSTLQPFWKT